jgi:hypothetical protein
MKKILSLLKATDLD